MANEPILFQIRVISLYASLSKIKLEFNLLPRILQSLFLEAFVLTLIFHCCIRIFPQFNTLHTTFRRWGDKTSYLKNVKCSGEQKNMVALTL